MADRDAGTAEGHVEPGGHVALHAIDNEADRTDRRALLRGLSIGSAAIFGAGIIDPTMAKAEDTPTVAKSVGDAVAVVDFNDGRLETGLEVMRQIGWGTNEGVRALSEDLWKITTETNFGTIWSRPGLSLREREIICMTILITIGAHGVALHFKNARTLGITDEEIEEIIIQAVPYAGLPRALSAMALFRQVQKTGEAKL